MREGAVAIAAASAVAGLAAPGVSAAVASPASPVSKPGRSSSTTGAPTPVGRVTAVSASAGAAEDAAALAAADPASTGGLLEALLAGDLGMRPALPEAWAEAARAFRLSAA